MPNRILLVTSLILSNSLCDAGPLWALSYSNIKADVETCTLCLSVLLSLSLSQLFDFVTVPTHAENCLFVSLPLSKKKHLLYSILS